MQMAAMLHENINMQGNCIISEKSWTNLQNEILISIDCLFLFLFTKITQLFRIRMELYEFTEMLENSNAVTFGYCALVERIQIAS